MNQIQQLAKNIKLVIFDVDGVLTDGSLFFDNQGQEYKAFNAKDGHGIRLLQQGDLQVALITARTSQLLLHRADNLEIERELIYQGYRDKRVAFADLLEKTGMQAENIAYVGDDVIDLPIMSKVGLAIAVGDAHPFVKKQADWVSQAFGGRGAVRETCEMILDAQDKLDDILQSYLA